MCFNSCDNTHQSADNPFCRVDIRFLIVPMCSALHCEFCSGGGNWTLWRNCWITIMVSCFYPERRIIRENCWIMKIMSCWPLESTMQPTAKGGNLKMNYVVHWTHFSFFFFILFSIDMWLLSLMMCVWCGDWSLLEFTRRPPPSGDNDTSGSTLPSPTVKYDTNQTCRNYLCFLKENILRDALPKK